MTPNISITLNTPHVTIERYSELTGLPVDTINDMLADGRLECKYTRFSSTHFLRVPVFQPSAGTLPASGCSGIHEVARCYIPSASAL
ncbi:hypothetical protein SB6423_00547 [Klebsiella pasteurii]|nr:hypothetical protein SB6423_00547 [Klebsiella pasteurii]